MTRGGAGAGVPPLTEARRHEVGGLPERHRKGGRERNQRRQQHRTLVHDHQPAQGSDARHRHQRTAGTDPARDHQAEVREQPEIHGQMDDAREPPDRDQDDGDQRPDERGASPDGRTPVGQDPQVGAVEPPLRHLVRARGRFVDRTIGRGNAIHWSAARLRAAPGGTAPGRVAHRRGPVAGIAYPAGAGEGASAPAATPGTRPSQNGTPRPSMPSGVVGTPSVPASCGWSTTLLEPRRRRFPGIFSPASSWWRWLATRGVAPRDPSRPILCCASRRVAAGRCGQIGSRHGPHRSTWCGGCRVASSAPADRCRRILAPEPSRDAQPRTPRARRRLPG